MEKKNEKKKLKHIELLMIVRLTCKKKKRLFIETNVDDNNFIILY